MDRGDSSPTRGTGDYFNLHKLCPDPESFAVIVWFGVWMDTKVWLKNVPEFRHMQNATTRSLSHHSGSALKWIHDFWSRTLSLNTVMMEQHRTWFHGAHSLALAKRWAWPRIYSDLREPVRSELISYLQKKALELRTLAERFAPQHMRHMRHMPQPPLRKCWSSSGGEDSELLRLVQLSLIWSWTMSTSSKDLAGLHRYCW